MEFLLMFIVSIKCWGSSPEIKNTAFLSDAARVQWLEKKLNHLPKQSSAFLSELTNQLSDKDRYYVVSQLKPLVSQRIPLKIIARFDRLDLGGPKNFKRFLRLAHRSPNSKGKSSNLIIDERFVITIDHRNLQDSFLKQSPVVRVDTWMPAANLFSFASAIFDLLPSAQAQNESQLTEADQAGQLIALAFATAATRAYPIPDNAEVICNEAPTGQLGSARDVSYTVEPQLIRLSVKGDRRSQELTVERNAIHDLKDPLIKAVEPKPTDSPAVRSVKEEQRRCITYVICHQQILELPEHFESVHSSTGIHQDEPLIQNYDGASFSSGTCQFPPKTYGSLSSSAEARQVANWLPLAQSVAMLALSQCISSRELLSPSFEPVVRALLRVKSDQPIAASSVEKLLRQFQSTSSGTLAEVNAPEKLRYLARAREDSSNYLLAGVSNYLAALADVEAVARRCPAVMQVQTPEFAPGLIRISN